MRAIRFHAYGEAEVLRFEEAPTPAPGSGEARVRVAAIGVNPADWKRRAGWFQTVMPLPFPQIPGSDAAGVVDAVGEGVTDLAVGDRVLLLTSPMEQGAYAEYVVAPALEMARLPDGLDFANAAALPTPGLTGSQLIREHVRPAAGALVLVTGATGAVGRFALHAAKEAQARVVAAVRPAQAQAALQLGADRVIALGAEDWDGSPFDGVADTIGGPDVARLCRHVAPGGVIATVSTSPIAPDDLPVQPIFVALHGDRDLLAGLAAAVARGDVTAPIAKRLPLAEAQLAHRLVEAGGLGGKIILEP